MSLQPADVFPIFGLRIVTPEVDLRLPTDDDLCELASLAVEGIHDEDNMPFNVAWTRGEPDDVRRGVMQHAWQVRAAISPEAWTLAFGVWSDGVLVGTQALQATSFAELRSVDTGSWVGRAHQGKGIGKAMRRAVLHLAFEGLGADEALTEARADNAASLGVTRSLGYVENGRKMHLFGDQPAPEVMFRMDRDIWAAQRRDGTEIIGLEACRSLLGA